ncbi:MAG: hypothetical protein A2428_04245 [Bdellovibrionales bacterium RIFOXYC1_FULL_54_43]|nr:MAG: hypothetical protein A2428_04245 [Bdellovibrionales bacterium RIFOXYC1_FULL_54_43]OFZ80368.1 MAG: hypothetical protein A2603_13375 [Bdellovibrionales bacterium RIFOXYD1_FULL_55_31]
MMNYRAFTIFFMPVVISFALFCPRSECAQSKQKFPDCDIPLDLREPGQSMHGMPIFDQRGLGNGVCYLVAAVQIAEAARRARLNGDPRQRISASAALAEMATFNSLYRHELNPYFTQGSGFTCDAMDHLRSHGACDSSKMPFSDPFLGDTGRSPDDEATVKWFMNTFQASEEYKAAARTLAEILSAEQVRYDEVEVFQKRKQEVLHRLCPKCVISNSIETRIPPEIKKATEAVLHHLHELDSQEFTMKMALHSNPMLSACKKPENRLSLHKLPKCTTEPFLYEIGEFLKEHLSQPKPVPVALTTCFAVLQYNEKQSIRQSSDIELYKRKCEKHAILVIGRRTIGSGNSSRCEYLIRNSYGEKCSRDEPGRTCDRGDYWIDAEVLEKNIYQGAALDY